MAAKQTGNSTGHGRLHIDSRNQEIKISTGTSALPCSFLVLLGEATTDFVASNYRVGTEVWFLVLTVRKMAKQQCSNRALRLLT